MSSFQDYQVDPDQSNTPVNAPAPVHVQPKSNNFLNGYVDLLGIRIPNIVLIILLCVVCWLLWTEHQQTISLKGATMVGGALETSSSVDTSFFDRFPL